jgi:hypothetical protein
MLKLQLNNSIRNIGLLKLQTTVSRSSSAVSLVKQYPKMVHINATIHMLADIYKKNLFARATGMLKGAV